MADHRPADDLSIPDNEPLYIRIFPSPDSLVPVEGGFRPHSGSVKGRDKNKPISIDLGSLCTPEETRDRGPNGNFHVAMVTAASLRQLGLRIIKDPINDNAAPNPAHALVIGSKVDQDNNKMGGLTNGEAEKFARAARIVILTPQTQ